MELIELRAAARRHRKAGILVVVLILLAGAWSVSQAQPAYRATSTLVLTPKVELFNGRSSATIYRIIFPNVLAEAKSAPLLNRARQRFEETKRSNASITARFTPNSGALSLSATSADPIAATAWSRAVSEQLANDFHESTYFTIGVIELAPGASKSGQRLEMLRAAGAVGLAGLGFIITVFSLELLAEWADPTLGLRTRGIAVLGNIPLRRRRKTPDPRDPQLAEAWSVLASRVTGSKGDRRRVVVSSNQFSPMQQYTLDGLTAGLEVLGTPVRRVDALTEGDDGPAAPSDAPGTLTLVDGPGLHALSLLRKVVGPDGHCVVVFHLNPATFMDDVASIRELMATATDRVAVLVVPSRRAGLVGKSLSTTPPRQPSLHARRRKKNEQDEAPTEMVDS